MVTILLPVDILSSRASRKDPVEGPVHRRPRPGGAAVVPNRPPRTAGDRSGATGPGDTAAVDAVARPDAGRVTKHGAHGIRGTDRTGLRSRPSGRRDVCV